MKKLVIFIAALLLATTQGWAQDKEMRIRNSDGSVYLIPIAQVDSIKIESVTWAQDKVIHVYSSEGGGYVNPVTQVDSITIKAKMKICNVDNPLQDIAWLKEYCESLQEREDISSFIVDLYLDTYLDTYEPIFFITDETKHFDECPLEYPQYYMSYRLNCINCNGDTIFHWEWVIGNCFSIDDFEGMRRYDEFRKGKEIVDRLLRYNKQ